VPVLTVSATLRNTVSLIKLTCINTDMITYWSTNLQTWTWYIGRNNQHMVFQEQYGLVMQYMTFNVIGCKHKEPLAGTHADLRIVC